ncbi:MAG: hypothetical protein ACNA8R_01935 [Nitriliruptoraceae bacterium]
MVKRLPVQRVVLMLAILALAAPALPVAATEGADPGDLRVADAGLTFDENGASLSIPVPGQVSVEQRVTSGLPRAAAWRLSVDAPNDVRITVPRSIQVPAGASRSFTIDIDARDVPMGEVRHAQLELTHGNLSATLPITIERREPQVTLEHSCDPLTLARNATTDCSITITNTAQDAATVNVMSTLPRQLALDPGSVVGAEVVGNGFRFSGTLGGAEVVGNGVRFSGTLVGAEPPGVAITPGGSPFGYLPLAGFEVEPLGGIGDESIANVSTPPFRYGGEVYDEVGVVSNGYAVVGGGTGADIGFVNQFLPDPDRPNNVLAPFWTDLNPAAGGALRVGVVSPDSNSNEWIVVEWDKVPNWSNTSQVNSFQIWIPLLSNTGDESQTEITYAYGPELSAGDGGFLTVGAENVDGTKGAMLYFDRNGTLPQPDSSATVTWPEPEPEPDQTHTITYRAVGRTPGAWQSCASMTGDIFLGTNIACVPGEVTAR